MIEFLTYLGLGVFCIVGLFIAYMSSHLVSEKHAGKTLPLPWEKGGWKIFNKADVKYRDGDNT